MIPGAEVTVVKLAPMGDPMEVQVHGYELTLRLAEADQIDIEPIRQRSRSHVGVDRARDPDHPGLGESGKYHSKEDEHPLLTLVNPWNPLPSDWEVDLVDLSNGSQIDRRCYDALQEMMDACRDAGYEPLICSAYRTQETQQELFDKKVAAFEAEGKSHDQAVQEGGHPRHQALYRRRLR